MPAERPILGITMGDPAGIGPEILAKVLADRTVYRLCRPLVLGTPHIMEAAARITCSPLEMHPVSCVEEARFEAGAPDILEVQVPDLRSVVYGKVDPAAGEAAFLFVHKAIELALAHAVGAVVTCPINKASIQAAGRLFSGHTEIFAHYTRTRDYAMLLADGDFRIIHVSTHVPLREAISLVRKDRIVTVTGMLDKACRKFGVSSPRIGIAGLNPHAGDSGIFGDEEAREITPAVEEARRLGLNAEGPVPPDTLFAKAKSGWYDGCVAMYHDQGHIPFKMLGFSFDGGTGRTACLRGVNITLGLPIVRTSVDHGTAFEIAGQGVADASGLKQAISMAVQLAVPR